MELMPDIICAFELNKVAVKGDLNLGFYEETMIHLQVGKVTAVTWKPDEPREIEIVKACFVCLTLKRKVIFVSVDKEYVWMVQSKILLPECDACERKLIVGIQFPYNQYRRQISTQELDYYFGIELDFMVGYDKRTKKRIQPEVPNQGAPQKRRKRFGSVV
uniref:AlNc14C124G6752 protein n=1 Tax=Albugo laibachii Nc14 TaxID=890382 RepID=F0WJM8_9STRA|nr:AlNc14C124G6752 [Albugo laibachii Nc14]|eukprot:CCA21477.1 AlNc14C124G6752 [Albugo laibachii Nc14]